MSENKIKEMLDVTMEKMRALADADTVIGTPVNAGNVILVPVSKVSFGLATGGSDFNTKSVNPMFAGGGGAGVTVTPLAFIAVTGDNVRILPVYNDMTTVDKAINMAPELIDKVKSVFKKENKSEQNKTEE